MSSALRPVLLNWLMKRAVDEHPYFHNDKLRLRPKLGPAVLRASRVEAVNTRTRADPWSATTDRKTCPSTSVFSAASNLVSEPLRARALVGRVNRRHYLFVSRGDTIVSSA